MLDCGILSSTAQSTKFHSLQSVGETLPRDTSRLDGNTSDRDNSDISSDGTRKGSHDEH